jgi:hypothetical protein
MVLKEVGLEENTEKPRNMLLSRYQNAGSIMTRIWFARGLKPWSLVSLVLI